MFCIFLVDIKSHLIIYYIRWMIFVKIVTKWVPIDSLESQADFSCDVKQKKKCKGGGEMAYLGWGKFSSEG